jgi:hypothetical protein
MPNAGLQDAFSLMKKVRRDEYEQTGDGGHRRSRGIQRREPDYSTTKTQRQRNQVDQRHADDTMTPWSGRHQTPKFERYERKPYRGQRYQTDE